MRRLARGRALLLLLWLVAAAVIHAAAVAAHARTAAEHLHVLGDDVKPGKLTSFPQSVNLEDGEVVIFAWIVYESRAKRDEVNDKVMQDPRMDEFMKPENMPFDGKRMFWGGFVTVVEF